MSQERETTVAEVMFSDEPDAKRAAVATEEGTPAKAISKHPLKNIERGNSVLKLCTYKGAFRRFADPRPTRRVPSRALAARDATMRDSHVRARRFLHAPFSTCSSRAIPRLLRRVFPGDRARCAARAPLASLERGSNIPDAIAHRTRPPRRRRFLPRPPRARARGYGEDS